MDRSAAPRYIARIVSWDVSTLDVEVRKPEILSSGHAARLVALRLAEGERLQDHQVHERAWIVVVEGELEVEADGGAQASGGPGLLVELDPGERHEVRALSDSRFLLFLAPWGGEGHPGTMTLDEKAHVRERAQERAG